MHRELPDPVGDSTDVTAYGLDVDLYMVFAQGLEVLVASRLTYARADPYAVCLVCHIDSAVPATWYLSRDLLAAGLWEPAGIGDVSIRPGAGMNRDSVFITLGAADERVVLRGSAREVRRFLDHSLRIVPLGLEHRHVDLDALVRHLTGDG